MKKSLFNDTVDYFEKCPNCEENTYYDGICENCGIGKATLYMLKNSTGKHINNIKKDIKEIFEERKLNLKLDYLNYTSYSIIVINGKVCQINFKFKATKGKYKDKVKKFRISLNYDFIEKEIKETHFQETDKEEREKVLNINKLSNLKIFYIQPKVKVGYGEKKHINYYSFMGLNFSDLKCFIEKVLKNYHNL